MTMSRVFARWLVLGGVAFLWGCVSTPERNPVPEALHEQALVPGIPDARDWSDRSPGYIDPWFQMDASELRAAYPDTFGVPHHYLAISGGGPRGAYTAGILKGWTEAGTRPEFTIVTGVSTGAIIAPFAFLGPRYDGVLEEIYTTMSTDDALETKGKLTALLGDSGADVSPLRARLEAYVDDELVAAIAREAARGRVLTMGTTHLDAARPVTWNITRIAASGSPNARELIIDIIMASAAIPAVFPPVLFEVEAGGGTYDELHVDGGASSHVYLYPLDFDWTIVTERMQVPGRPQLYVIRNGKLRRSWSETTPNTLAIAARTVGSLMNSSVHGDMYRLYLGPNVTDWTITSPGFPIPSMPCRPRPSTRFTCPPCSRWATKRPAAAWTGHAPRPAWSLTHWRNELGVVRPNRR